MCLSPLTDSDAVCGRAHGGSFDYSVSVVRVNELVRGLGRPRAAWVARVWPGLYSEGPSLSCVEWVPRLGYVWI